tara:strand:+ start:6497 stop:7735 length:1239 start_codon:yes stop_codon:yes gene_type:complete
MPALPLHPKQLEVYSAPHRFKTMVAGRRSGKTFLARVIMIDKAGKKKKQRIWYVAPTYQMARDIMWEELKDAIPRRWIKKINDTRLRILLINGSVIELKGADKPDTLRGVGLHYVVLDEAQDMKPDVWGKVIRPTLSATRGGALIQGTPKGFNILYDHYRMGQRGDYQQAGVWKSWQFPTSQSPFVPPEEIEAARNELDPKTFRQEYEASFESMAGRVYYPFDRTKHVGKFPFNPGLPIWVGQDFNIDPMSSVIIQPQPSGELWVVDEIYLPSSNTADVCAALDRKFWRWQDAVTIYPDPAGSYRQSGRGESDLDVFRQAGFRKIKHRKKHPPIADRVNAVNSLLETASGVVRLHIDESCKNTIKSLEQTIYKPGSRDIDKQAGAEHATDALGYPLEFEFPIIKHTLAGISL